jgi:TRAP transporter TAXI family solute receptor
MRLTARSATLALSVIAIAVIAMLSPATAAPPPITIGTAGVMGVYHPLGGAVCRMVNVTRKVHKLRCSVEPSEGSVANIRDVMSGAVNIGIAQSDTQYYARQGEGPFKDKPQPKLRALFSVYPEMLVVMAREEANIRRFEDLKGKRVSIGPPGSGTRATMDLVMNAHGITRGDLKAAVEMKFVEMPPALCENKIDAFVFVAGHPNVILQDAANGCRTRIVPVAGPAVDELLAGRPYYAKAEIPSGAYKGTDSAQPTIGTVATLVVSADMPEDMAYAITKAVFDNFDDFRKLHPAVAGLGKGDALKGTPVPLHPGAARYFKEVGLI